MRYSSCNHVFKQCGGFNLLKYLRLNFLNIKWCIVWFFSGAGTLSRKGIKETYRIPNYEKNKIQRLNKIQGIKTTPNTKILKRTPSNSKLKHCGLKPLPLLIIGYVIWNTPLSENKVIRKLNRLWTGNKNKSKQRQQRDPHSFTLKRISLSSWLKRFNCCCFF